MSSALLFFANMVSQSTPQTRLFRLRRALFARAGVDVDSTARVNGRVSIQYPNVRIGRDTWVGARTEFAATRSARITVGDRCDISQDVLFVCGTHEIGRARRRAGRGHSRPISIGDGTWVGARATFTAGASVGSGCVVGAGALVRGVFGDNELILGTPARVHRTLPT